MVDAPSRLEIERELIWRSCRESAWYFIANYVDVKTPTGGYQKWDTSWEHQMEIAEWMQTKVDAGEKTASGALKARQVGWTTVAHAVALWNMFFHDHREWLSVSVGEDEAKDALTDKIKQPYERLPGWMRRRGPEVVSDTSELFTFANGSGMRAIPSTERSGRSRAVFGCLFDEAAFMQDAGTVFAAVEPAVYGPLFMFSTANGMGDLFHDTWVDSLADDSEWDMRFYPWDVVPDRDAAWYEKTKLRYRTKRHLFFQEYPSNPTEAFMKSGRTAFDIEALSEQYHWSEPVSRFDLAQLMFHDKLDIDDRFGMSMLDVDARADLELHVWAEPFVLRDGEGRAIQEPNYAIGVDVAEGLAHGDNSAISVRDVNTDTQVATVATSVPIYDLGPIVELLGYWYHTALIGVERNSFGLVPLEYLQRVGYPRIYRMDPIAEKGRGQRSPRYGWLTTRSTKPKMVQDLVKATVHKSVTLQDARWLQEATTFVANGKGRYEANGTATDDLMMAELIVHQVQLDIDRFPIVWHDDVAPVLTFGDVFSIVSYAEGRPTDADQLDQPIGQPTVRDPVTRSFVRN